MHITLIGMSNIGKSHWSRKLAAESGFTRIACDGEIERKLAPELEKHGYSGLRGLARWMGQPYDPQYPETSRKYSACERTVMQEAIERIGNSQKPLVLDTTGSVIYGGDDILAQLRSLTRVVYLEACPDHMTQLFERYIAHPKPVIWGNAFAPRSGEAPQDALKRCYPELLASRAKLYAKLAHRIIPYAEHRAAKANIAFLTGVA